MHLPITTLTPDAFAPFGEVIALPGGDPEAAGPGWAWWSETALLPRTDRPYAVGYLRLEPAPLQVDWAEYHRASAEAIVPLGAPCLVHVGPPGDPPAWERFAIFRLDPGQAVVVRPGVWHGAPLAIDRPLTALVLLRQGTGAEDVHTETRAEGPIHIVHAAAATSEGQDIHASR